MVLDFKVSRETLTQIKAMERKIFWDVVLNHDNYKAPRNYTLDDFEQKLQEIVVFKVKKELKENPDILNKLDVIECEIKDKVRDLFANNQV
jgi:hypothetical protein